LGQHLGFEETVSNAWKIPVKSNNPTIILNTKLNNVRTTLKEWNKYLSQLSLFVEKCRMVFAQVYE
jgi:hypothetical protein